MSKEMVCTNCGFKGRPKQYTKGSFLVELLLWLCFLVPGLLYTVWRVATRYKGCPNCGHPHMIPKDSPMAEKILA
jgi:DNA-directed RNA polymerase subunit RPC12/RpoP